MAGVVLAASLVLPRLKLRRLIYWHVRPKLITPVSLRDEHIADWKFNFAVLKWVMEIRRSTYCLPLPPSSLPPTVSPAPSCRSPGPLLRAFAAVASQDGDLIVLSQWQAAHVSLAPWERTAARQVCRLRSGGWVFLSLFQSFIFRLCFRLCPLSLTLSLCLSLLTLTLSRSVFSHTHSLSLICLLLSLLLSHPHSLSFFFPSFSASLFPSLFRSLCLSISLFPSHSLAIACSLLSFSLCSLF